MRTTTTALCVTLLTLAGFTLAACQSTGTSAQSTGPLPSVVQSTSDRAETQGKPALVVVSATEWCRPCKTYHQNTLNTPSTQAALKERVVYQHVDFDTNKDAAKAMGVTSLPTTILIVDGAPVARFTGDRDSEALLNWIDKNAG